MKRFYKAVGVTAENGILLDSRPVRTPAKALLILPNNALAKAVAGEWCAQKDDIDPHAMPFTGLANPHTAPCLPMSAESVARPSSPSNTPPSHP